MRVRTRRMRFSLVSVISCIILACCFAAKVSAQDLVARPGQTARLQLIDQHLTGRIVSIQQDILHLQRTMDGPVREIALSSIRGIDVRFPGLDRKKRTVIGSLVGGAVGAAGGIYLSRGGACSDCVTTTRDLVVGMLLFTGVSSALGGVIGYASTPSRWVPAQLPR